MIKAVLALEDGSLFFGKAFASVGENWGEVVFNTAMTGYEGVLTDPSYCGEIVVMTYPLIGNYGVNEADFESKRSFVRGLVVRDATAVPSSWRSAKSLADYLERENVIGLTGVDTRAITRRIRDHGVMRGVISTECFDPAELVDKAQSKPDLSDQDLVDEVSTRESFTVPGAGYRIVLIDLGAKLNIIRCLSERGCEVVVVPPSSSVEDILALNPHGIMISNGPGDPVRISATTATVKALIGKVPIFGICLGHQVLALALGGRTYKLKFGHRGANHPVKDLATGRVYITSHNHGFSVDPDSLAGLDVEVSHISLNDNTVEGIRHKTLPAFAVQYHPEASPGPNESEYLFDEFMRVVAEEVK